MVVCGQVVGLVVVVYMVIVFGFGCGMALLKEMHEWAWHAGVLLVADTGFGMEGLIHHFCFVYPCIRRFIPVCIFGEADRDIHQFLFFICLV